jgi:hypothetical protein
LLGAAEALVGVLAPRTGRGVEQLEAGPHQGLVHRFVAHADVRLGAREARAVAVEQLGELVPRKCARLARSLLLLRLGLLLVLALGWHTCLRGSKKTVMFVVLPSHLT